MKVGVSQLVFSGGTADFLRAAAQAGYECVELRLRGGTDLDDHSTDAALAGYLALARELGLELVSLCHTHCTGNLLDSGEARQTSLKQTIAGLETARRLGIDVTLHTLGRPRADLYYDAAWQNALQSLRELVPHCERLGVSIAIEMVWNGFLFSPLEMRRLLEEVGSPLIGFYFDPGNMAVFQFPQHWVRILASHIQRVHLKDWKGNALAGGWPALLEGTVDFPVVMRELRAAGYDGPLISEVPPSVASLEATAASIRRIIAM